MKTIPRSHKAKIANYRGTHTRALVYSLENYFVPQVADAEWIWDQFVNHGRGKLKLRNDGTLQIDVHGNLWYVLSSPESGSDEGPHPAEVTA